MTEQRDPTTSAQIERFSRILALAAVFLAGLPTLVGLISLPPGSTYLGHQLNLDDQMVYAAWMNQAMHGRVLFENLFTTDSQPSLTFHLLFLLMGWLAKLIGIVASMVVTRLVLTYAFVRLFSRFLVELGLPVFTAKFAITMACFGGGIGYVMWERFGEAARNSPAALASLTGGRAPIDVWQPEAFVYPSMLTNALFVAALCLIVVVLRQVWRARESWSAVPLGAAAFCALMNIHSYDALLLVLVVVVWFAALAASRQASWAWFGRVSVIGLGAVPAAAWFLHVLSKDPVFQARAATPTYSPSFSQVALGLLPSLILGVASIFGSKVPRARLAGIVTLALLGVLWFALPGGTEAMQLDPVTWGVFFVAVAATVILAASQDRAKTMLLSWALVGVVALYFPAMFQRKLSMGLIVPWATLAAFGLAALIERVDRSARNMVAALGLVIACASSILWLQREISFIRDDVSRTSVHSVYYSRDASRILERLASVRGRKVVLAMPGVSNSEGPADFGRPIISDLNAVLSGMAGATTFAGHWSETPNYSARRNRLTAFFLAQTPIEDQEALLAETGADYLVQPNPEAFRSVEGDEGSSVLADLSRFGTKEYDGSQLWLIKVRRQQTPDRLPE